MVKKNVLIPFLFILCAVLLPLAGCGGGSSSSPAAPSTSAFTTPTPLIDSATLKGWIDNGALTATGTSRAIILDVNSQATFSAGHIPGAQFVNSSDIYQNRQEGPAVDVNMVPDGSHMDALIQKNGIDNNATIVFTSSSILNATRAYWTFRYWGFPKEKLKLLNGINTAWTTAYGLSTTTTPTATPSTYSVKSNASLRADLRASLSEMMSVASGSVTNAVILDTRTTSTTGSYAMVLGSTPGVFSPSGDYVVFEGHMKGAKALDYTTLYDATTLQFKTPDAIKTLLAAVGVDGTKTTYVHCRTGVIASLPFFILDALLDWPVEDYDGSWSQWGQLSANSANGGMLAADSPWRTDIPALSEAVAYNHAAKAVEELALDGSVCSSTLSTTNVITYSSSCTPSAPDSYALSGNQVEEADAAYMGH
ncbi:MAG: selenite/tellurite reduction operon rhodanese-like protein ExtH [Nitrospiraceae bacterium]|nr:selenite/tellurite reduction operon rhodanese-like protein ExtH [Nitrospiraceae bacterium]